MDSIKINNQSSKQAAASELKMDCEDDLADLVGVVEEDTAYECTICYAEYATTGKKQPVLLNCGHTICSECSKKISETEAKGIRIKCPYDKLEHVYPKQDEPCKKNYSLMNLIYEREKKNAGRLEKKCLKHKS